MKVVILCGGQGTRLREETEYRPKPMVEIGGRPILWHIMKLYAHYGHKDFILCLGYKGEVIKEYFRNYLWNTCDATIRLGRNPEVRFHNSHDEEDWTVTFADTGDNALTGYRVRAVEPYIGKDENFLLTYGDGVGNINLAELVKAHEKGGKAMTLTAVHPPGRFGEIKADADGTVVSFNEKPQVGVGYINGGFMACTPEIFRYLTDDPKCQLEIQPMQRLCADGKLGSYTHHGFWQPMDTYAEFTLMNQLWSSGNAPWKVW